MGCEVTAQVGRSGGRGVGGWGWLNVERKGIHATICLGADDFGVQEMFHTRRPEESHHRPICQASFRFAHFAFAIDTLHFNFFCQRNDEIGSEFGVFISQSINLSILMQWFLSVRTSFSLFPVTGFARGSAKILILISCGIFLLN